MAFKQEMDENARLRGEGWRTVTNDPEEKRTDKNVVIQLPDYALLGKEGKMQMLTCGCDSTWINLLGG